MLLPLIRKCVSFCIRGKHQDDAAVTKPETEKKAKKKKERKEQEWPTAKAKTKPVQLGYPCRPLQK